MSERTPTATQLAADIEAVLSNCTDVSDRARIIQQIGYSIYDAVKRVPALVPYIEPGSQYSELESVGPILSAVIKHHQATFKATHQSNATE